jgi:serine/threonine protein kinase
MSGNELECESAKPIFQTVVLSAQLGLADATSRDLTCNAFAPGQQPEFFLNRSASPFRHESNIGTGSIAIVEAVTDKFTNERFALKTYRRFWGRQLEDIKHIFKNEVKIMKRLSSHVHMVEIRRYCMIGQQMSILLSPVASNGDLGAYLNVVLESGMSIEQESLLDCAFGCLISGLAYMHKHTIRHKDIKPQNILVHEGRVLYTDFGIAFEADQSNTTTTGLAGICSRRYCAPEVQANTSRNRKSDIWSLGCVFVEMLDVLEQETALRDNDQLPYCEEHKIEEVRRKLLHSDVTRRARKELFRICYDMLEPNQVHRIDSNSALRRIARLDNLKEDSATRLICDDCLATGDCRDIASMEEMAVDFAASSLNADPATDIASSQIEIRPSLSADPAIDNTSSQIEIRTSLNADPATDIASSQIEIRTSLSANPAIDNTSSQIEVRTSLNADPTTDIALSQTEIRASLNADPAADIASSLIETRTSLNAGPATDIASPRKKVRSITNNDENQRKKERTVPNMLFDNENERAMSPKAVYPGISRYYCYICGELGHDSSDCPNECWACGEASTNLQIVQTNAGIAISLVIMRATARTTAMLVAKQGIRRMTVQIGVGLVGK